MTTINIDPAAIEKIIRHVAATEVLPRFRNLRDEDKREKKPNDFVTIADEESEKAFTKLLAEALPGSLVVGEEAVSKDKGVLGRIRESAPVWIIDPIDGTYNFMTGRELFGILIALVKDGVTEYGWAYDVPGNRMAYARRGGGAWLDGKPLKVSCDKEKLGDLVGQGGGAKGWHFTAARKYFGDIVNIRCALHDFMNVFTGKADFVVHINYTKPWDHAALCLIMQEAGGHVALNDGQPYHPGLHEPTFLVAAPSKAWWEKLYPVLRECLEVTEK